MADRELRTVHPNINEEAVHEFNEHGSVAVSGIVHAGLAAATSAETVRLFGRPNRLSAGVGQVSSMRNIDPTNTALGVILNQVQKAGGMLDLRMGSRSGAVPYAQVLEVGEATDEARWNAGRTGISAVVNLTGGVILGARSGDEEAVTFLEPGTVAFLGNEHNSQYRLAPIAINAANLVIAGVKIHAAVRDAA